MKLCLLIFLLHEGLFFIQGYLVNYQTPSQTYQPPGSFYQPGAAGVNIQQLQPQPVFNPPLQQGTIQGIPIGNQQSFVQGAPVVYQQNGVQGIPISTYPQTIYPGTQQVIQQISPVPGPIKFPQ
ncbi:hypothetical protein Bhyg_15541 [Pseudolycoriella hygida]|uniref:Uncharacterized protein n=1 Tax=Pseudolycoriella hygida TaxID=35572 RepID=A0A9Q0ML37_9DIPT|nr:hypothetical protein Bhyg_15541 [Pseudolycoriella hygida]